MIIRVSMSALSKPQKKFFKAAKYLVPGTFYQTKREELVVIRTLERGEKKTLRSKTELLMIHYK